MTIVMADSHPSPETKMRNNGWHHIAIVIMLSVVFSMPLMLPCSAKNTRVPCAMNAPHYEFGDLRGFDVSNEAKESVLELEHACSDSDFLCFPSTLVNLKELHPNTETIRQAFCTGPPLRDTRSQNSEFVLEPTSSAYLEISPSLLDWGMSSLLSPALVYLTVTNNHNSSILHVFEPFSTVDQFYAYSFEEMQVGPGEVGSIAFIFLPKLLGSVSGQIVLQTNFGGFVVQCKGIGIESRYGAEPFRSFDVSSDGRLTWNLSLYNPFYDGLYVDEVSAQVLVHSESTVYDSSVCSIEAFHQPSSQFGSSCKDGDMDFMQLEVSPQKTEAIVKVNLWPPFKGKVSGAICMELSNSKRDKVDTIIVPLETEVDARANYNSLSGSVSVFFESLVPWNGRRMVCSLSLRNSASSLLSVVHIADSSKVFEIKYTKGLLLYPGSVTQVALISYNPQIGSEDVSTGIPWESLNCKISVVYNDSASPQIIVPCQEFIHACHKSEAGRGSEGSYIGAASLEEKAKLTNSRSGSLESIIEESLPLKAKLAESLEADQMILRNWKSQGTMSKLSILKDHELLFPVVQLGTKISKLITVHNPTENAVIMQLLLNSGKIIDQCKYLDDSFSPNFVNVTTVEAQEGFSLPDLATTETIVQPFGSAQLGPIVFRPSKQCRWRSSALIRNNISGIEWLPLQAFGGSYSLVLLEGSKLIRKLEFNLSLPATLNLSSPDTLFNLKTIRKSCDHQLYKEVYAKNAGELPLEVKKLEISGTKCGLDGFTIHTCKGFSLEPGESVRLLVSYQPDFSATIVLRSINLIMFSGVLVIPMRASLPVPLISLCKKSLFWTVLWKLPALIFAAISILCLLLFLLYPISSESEGYSIKDEDTMTPISKVQRPSRVHRNARSTKTIQKDEKPEEESLLISRYGSSEVSVQENTLKTKDNKVSDHPRKTKSQSPPPTKMPDTPIASEASQGNNLTVRVVKERGRRRKQRANGRGLASKLEVSSSQSGNSTPSSPMSPNTFTPNSSQTSFSRVLEQQNRKQNPTETKMQEPQKTSAKPVLLTSASFPTSGWRTPGSSTSNLSSASPIAPYARAPGSKLSREVTAKKEENNAFDFTYDIWGNHFCDHLTCNPKDFSPKVFDASEGDSTSFFVKDPQSLMMMPSAQSVPPGHKVPPYNVDYLDEMK